MTIQYRLIDIDGDRSLSVFVEGQLVVANRSSHLLFDNIVEGLENGSLTEREVAMMVSSVGRAVEKSVEGISDRISFSEDRSELFFDGEKVDNTLSRHILRLLRERGTDGALPWVRFMEKLAKNPSKLSRIHLYSWLESAGDFTITASGDILGYKAVAKDRHSISSGSEDVTVNGRIFRGRIPNPDGAMISMPRELVNANREHACSVGLHIGNFDYAERFGGTDSVLLLVAVSPEDVVSVPADSMSQKMRACRYQVLCENRERSRIEYASWDQSDWDYDDDGDWY